MTHGRRPLTCVLLAACMQALSGCASTAPHWEARFGDAARHVQAQQLIDPSAPTRHGSKQATTDGRTVREATGRYVESFQAPPPTTVLNIGGNTR